jgi:hypothetical protein
MGISDTTGTCNTYIEKWWAKRNEDRTFPDFFSSPLLFILSPVLYIANTVSDHVTLSSISDLKMISKRNNFKSCKEMNGSTSAVLKEIFRDHTLMWVFQIYQNLQSLGV